MAEQHRIGPCRMCEYFDYSPADYQPDENAEVAPDNAVARCVQHEIREFQLTVAGFTSCNRFEERQEGLQIPPEESVSQWKQPAKV